MRSRFTNIAERGRICAGHFRSCEGDLYGMFIIKYPGEPLDLRIMLKVLACSAKTSLDIATLDERPKLQQWNWDHVSVSVQDSKIVPSWEMMSFVKEQFWDAEECVIQIHPPKSKYVNIHPGCLHLWKYAGSDMVMPPLELI